MQKLDANFPSLAPLPNLPQKALHALLSSGVDCVLVGMRKEPYVEDALAVLRRGAIEPVDLERLTQFGTVEAMAFLEKHKLSTQSMFNKVEE
jgi:hypothetical protein